jgi:hypothetical protein
VEKDGMMSASEPQAALSYLKRLHPSDQQHAEELRTFQPYVEENIDGMQYSPAEIRGSGVTEEVTDSLVKKGMKRQGMSWSRRGANNILALRARHINDQSRRIDLSVMPPCPTKKWMQPEAPFYLQKSGLFVIIVKFRNPIRSISGADPPSGTFRKDPRPGNRVGETQVRSSH